MRFVPAVFVLSFTANCCPLVREQCAPTPVTIPAGSVAVTALEDIAPPSAQSAYRVEGVVVDVLGAPIARARVVVSLSGGADVRTACDGSGQFVAGNLQHRPLRVTAHADGYSADGTWIRVGPWVRGREDSEGGFEACLRIELRDAVVVAGLVRDSDGAPCVGAHVVVDAKPLLEHSESHTTTDANGRYRLEHVPVGDVRIAVLAPHHVVAKTTLRLVAPVVQDFDLAAGQSATYRVTVEGARDEDWPRVRAWVRHRLSGNGTDWELGQIWPHARDGDTFVLADVPLDLGVSTLSLCFPGGWAQPTCMAFANPGEQTFCVRVVSYHRDTRTAAMRGIVHDCDGRAVAGLCIGQSDGTVAHTANDGTFGLPVTIYRDGSFILSVRGSDEFVIARRDDDVERMGEYVGQIVPERIHEITVARAASGRGTVADNHGTPVFGAAVELLVNKHQLRNVGDWPNTPIAATTSRRNGSFVLPRLDPTLPLDAWLVVKSAAGRVHLGPLRMQPGEVLDLGEIRLPSPAAIDGVYVDQDGHPEPGIEVLALCSEDAEHFYGWGAVTDRAGRFRFVGLREGSYRVRASEPFCMRWCPSPDFARLTLAPGQRATARRDLLEW